MPVSSSPAFFRWSVLFIACCVLSYRWYTLDANELAWDVFGYYLPLPATFVHHDPLLHDMGWIKQLLQDRPISSTLYQVTSSPEGHPMYFFFLGMSFLMAPFFLLAHAIAALTGQPMDGFSPPYQTTLAIGFVVYTFIGLQHWRRILLHFFPDRLAALILVLIAFGTNWFHFMTLKNLETANALFMLMAVLVWNTMEWYRTQRFKNLAWVAFVMALLALVKPSEVLAVLIPLLWGVQDRASLLARVSFFAHRWKQLLGAVAIGFAVLAPQLIYWRLMTGSFIFDSYQNPGVGLDIWSPHVIEVLFSYRKGWLLYTPIMVLSLIGFFFLYRRQRALFVAIAVWCGIAFWIIASWTEWWYGASYSVRPMITLYPLLSIPFGLCLQAIASQQALLRFGSSVAIGALVVLNLFQMWQHHHGILDPYRTTKAYYWAIFGKTRVPSDAEGLKSIERPFTQDHVFANPQDYRKVVVGRQDFEADVEDRVQQQVFDSAAMSRVFRLNGDSPFTPSISASYGSLTDADHAWVHVRARLKVPADLSGELPCVVVSMERKEGSYGYKTVCADDSTCPRDAWITIEYDYMLPPIRDPDDELRSYVWNRSSHVVLVDDVQLDLYVPKSTME